MRIITFISGIIFSILISSCYYNKRLVYLQDCDYSATRATLVENKKSPYRLQPADILSVQIKSSAEKEGTGIFHVATQTSLFAHPGSLFLDGYSGDAGRQIILPT